MQEEEAHQEEEMSHEQEEEEVTAAEMVDEADAEMVDEEEPSDPCGEADTEGPPPLVSVGHAVSPRSWISQSQERDWYGLRRDGRVEPDLPEPTWAWGR